MKKHIIQILLFVLCFWVFSQYTLANNPYSSELSESYQSRIDTIIRTKIASKQNTMTGNNYISYLTRVADGLNGLKSKYEDNSSIMNIIWYLVYEIEALRDNFEVSDEDNFAQDFSDIINDTGSQDNTDTNSNNDSDDNSNANTDDDTTETTYRKSEVCSSEKNRCLIWSASNLRSWTSRKTQNGITYVRQTDLWTCTTWSQSFTCTKGATDWITQNELTNNWTSAIWFCGTAYGETYKSINDIPTADLCKAGATYWSDSHTDTKWKWKCGSDRCYAKKWWVLLSSSGKVSWVNSEWCDYVLFKESASTWFRATEWESVADHLSTPFLKDSYQIVCYGNDGKPIKDLGYLNVRHVNIDGVCWETEHTCDMWWANYREETDTRWTWRCGNVENGRYKAYWKACSKNK